MWCLRRLCVHVCVCVLNVRDAYVCPAGGWTAAASRRERSAEQEILQAPTRSRGSSNRARNDKQEETERDRERRTEQRREQARVQEEQASHVLGVSRADGERHGIAALQHASLQEGGGERPDHAQ